MKAKEYVALFAALDPEHDVVLDVHHYQWDPERNQEWPMVLREMPQKGSSLEHRFQLARDPHPVGPYPHLAGGGADRLPVRGEIRQRILIERNPDGNWTFLGRFQEEFIRVDWFYRPGDPILYTRMRREGDAFVEAGPSRDGFLPYFSVRDAYHPFHIDPQGSP